MLVSQKRKLCTGHVTWLTSDRPRIGKKKPGTQAGVFVKQAWFQRA